MKDDLKELNKLCRSYLTNEPQDIKRSNDNFNKAADDYRAEFKKIEQEGYLDIFKEHANLKGSSVLEISSGSRRYTKALLSEGAYVECVEPAVEMVKVAKEELAEMGFVDGSDYVIYEEAIQNFTSDKKYDYIFLANSPMIRYVETYDKLYDLAQKGIFISGWLRRDDELYDKVAKTLEITPPEKPTSALVYLFSLYVTDGYYPNFHVLNNTVTKVEGTEQVARRYVGHYFGQHYTEEQYEIVLSTLKEFEIEEGKVEVTTKNLQGALYVEL